MSKIQLTLLFLLVGAIHLSAQLDVKINQWKSYLPYNHGRSITQSDSHVFFASKFSVYSIDKEERSVDFFSKVDGLSDVGTSILKYVPANETLIVSYQNSNIDLVKPNRIVNLPFIKEDANIVGDRAIYNIFRASDDIVYLACGFGIVELDVAREEFGFTTKTGIKINDLTVHQNSFYLSTEEGIYRANNNGINLQDFGNWDLLGAEEGFPDVYSSDGVVNYNDLLYLDINDTLFVLKPEGLEKVHYEEDHSIIYLTAESDHLLAGMYCSSTCAGKVLFFDEEHSIERSGNSCVDRPYYAIEDSENRVWYSDRWRQYRVSESITGACARVFYNSPYTEDAIEMVVDDGHLWVTTEAPPQNSGDGFYHYYEGEWETLNSRTKPTGLNGLLAAYTVAVHPENKKVYIGSLTNGLWEKEGDKYTLYDDDSSLLRAGDEAGKIRVGGLAFDQENNLWITNNTAQNPLVLLRNDGITWDNDFRNIPYRGLRYIAIDQAGNKWMSIDGSSQGLLIFNENDPNDPNDDQSRVITTSNSQLPNNRVNCITVDLEGDVWVGTAEGPIVFECGTNALEASCQGSRRIVEVDGFNGYLLETEDIRTIAVDGANRKWFGTTNGIFVQSSNGEEQIAFFDKDNSPLFDNEISDIAIDDQSGEVFIGTAKGLLSIRGEATDGGPKNSSEIYAFPNPVRPEYEGPIAIKGLARDANVKITDVNGQLVYETTAFGGQAIWNGNDYTGQRAASGVYLVFSTSTQSLENPDAIVTKILLLN